MIIFSIASLVSGSVVRHVCAGLSYSDQIYNLIVAIGMKNPDPYLINGTLTMSNNTWSKLAMIGTWLGDSTTL